MSQITKTLEKKVATLDARVAELSIDATSWRQRAMISESEERRLQSRLLVETAFRLDAERSLRAYRESSLVRLAWNRLRGIR